MGLEINKASVLVNSGWSFMYPEVPLGGFYFRVSVSFQRTKNASEYLFFLFFVVCERLVLFLILSKKMTHTTWGELKELLSLDANAL
jgi:hypothetical protein